MMAAQAELEYRRLRAPREDRAALIQPPLSSVGELLAAREQARHVESYDVQGLSLADLRREAREHLLRRAVDYTRQYRDVPQHLSEMACAVCPRPASGERILLAGHQPQLFHPGVWFKNFVLSDLAARHQAAAVNLLIDNDTVKQTAIRVPGGPPSSPHVRLIEYDVPGGHAPFEQRRVLRADLLRDFAERAMDQLRPLVADPLLRRFWPLVIERQRQTQNLGACLAQARHQLEGEWGLATLELPFSQICQSPAFYWFTAHLLAHLPRFWEIHNTALSEYRRVCHLRSASHPVPDLAAAGGWLEAPFWMFSDEDPRRRPLFARGSGSEVELSDRHGWELRLPLSPEGDASGAAQMLAELPARGVKLRTRALTTTLWARLALGDLFLHGIGGAKYDQVTDLMMARFFGLEPPPFLMLSATLHLPVPAPQISEAEVRDIDGQLRDLTFNPQRWLRGGNVPDEHRPQVEALLDAKQQWIATPSPPDARRRFQAIREINERLQPLVAPRRRQLLDQREQAKRDLQAASVLRWREYAFCLYREETLREFLHGAVVQR